ncbi:MAG: exopolysaccharide biosynthesis polyprenyl glycosylphosphotransferase [Flavobacteriaceae bacterium]|jgi:putative colanic acid biosynthesis UDP-glucose lipid carrier transferase|tara:strand:+ start:23041 stop:24399 length:1359 start_codon:yes stop_codon:yes gene_type:complete
MVKKYAGRYSKYLRPISIFFDLLVLNSFVYLYLGKELIQPVTIAVFSFLWIISALITKFYEVYRFTKFIKIVSYVFYQLLLFSIFVFAFFGVAENLNPGLSKTLIFLLYTFLLVSLFKFTLFYGLQSYRLGFGGNFRKTIIIGNDESVEELKEFFMNQKELGYENRKTFSFKSPSDLDLQECFDFILSRNIDEVYCSANELEENQLNLIIEFCENNFKILKFISKRGGLLSKKLKTDTYGLSTIQSLRQMPLSNDYNTLVKRFFDIVFSLFIIMFFLSWITPIIALLIKIESSGPVFFKQTRNGIKYKEFTCYKFRSMVENIDAHIQQATKNDKRVTKIGKILRKTSLDELPQFYNVLIGNMSVVGPRPHMIKENERYSKSVNKFMVRHFVKPGITGLAQVKGFRGEIETNEDIINRVKFDIYYLENWSLILDLNIVFLTTINFLTGHKKAY